MSHPAGYVARSGTASRVGVFVLGLVFVASTGALGALLGGAYVRFLMTPAADGWTGIARGLGGLMTGGLIAIVIAIFLVVPLARRGTRAVALAAAVAASTAAVLILVLYLARPNRPDQGSILISAIDDTALGECLGAAWLASSLSATPDSHILDAT